MSIHSLACLKLKLLCQEHTLGERPDPRINRDALGLELLAQGPEVLERVGEDLDELVVLELRLGVLVLRKGHVDGDVDHAQVGVAEAGVVEHDGRRLRDDADVARLLAQLADGGLLGRLAGVDEPRGDLERDAVDGRAVLPLQDNVLGAGGGVAQDGDDADAVNVAAGGAAAALGGLPGARLAGLVLVVDPGAALGGRKGREWWRCEVSVCRYSLYQLDPAGLLVWLRLVRDGALS